MVYPLDFPVPAAVACFLILWAASRAGSIFGKRFEDVHDDFSIILTATLTLLGLILGFAFSMAVNRYDQRKLCEEQEANAIGTEYLRTELLPHPDGEEVRATLRDYLAHRIQFYEARTRERARQISAATAGLHSRLWTGVRVPSQAQPDAVRALVVSGMNDVLNTQGYTQAAWWNRIPPAAWGLMAVIAVCASILLGLYLRVRNNPVLLMVLPAIVSISFFLIADIDSPRGGLIHVKPQNLISVAESLGRRVGTW